MFFKTVDVVRFITTSRGGVTTGGVVVDSEPSPHNRGGWVRHTVMGVLRWRDLQQTVTRSNSSENKDKHEQVIYSYCNDNILLNFFEDHSKKIKIWLI